MGGFSVGAKDGNVDGGALGSKDGNKVGKDGRTAYERIKGKRSSVQLVPFGERVLYLPLKPKGTRANKMDPKFRYGIWVGIHE